MQLRNGFSLLTMAAAMALPMVAPQTATAAVSFVMSVNVAPPAVPVYAQPVCPGPGFLWTPGYWAYGPHGYIWTAGAWVRPPAPGMLWTPAYWGWEGGHYRFHAGYWGPHVGYYGGVRYGYGYPGTGFEGGEWRGHDFFYNSAAWHVDQVHMRNVYRREAHFEDHHGPVHDEYRGRVEEHPGPPPHEVEHHDNGNHNGWYHDDHGHDDHGHDDHGHGRENR